MRVGLRRRRENGFHGKMIGCFSSCCCFWEKDGSVWRREGRCWRCVSYATTSYAGVVGMLLRFSRKPRSIELRQVIVASKLGNEIFFDVNDAHHIYTSSSPTAHHPSVRIQCATVGRMSISLLAMLPVVALVSTTSFGIAASIVMTSYGYYLRFLSRGRRHALLSSLGIATEERQRLTTVVGFFHPYWLVPKSSCSFVVVRNL